MTKLSHKAYSILLAQLIATLIYYPFTVTLAGLGKWSAFLKSTLLHHPPQPLSSLYVQLLYYSGFEKVA